MSGVENPTGERLQKVLARAGVASRRKAEALIEAGRVTVDGRVATLGQRVGPDAEIRVRGERLERRREHVTFALHKPAGVVTTADDPQRRPTVMTLVPEVPGLHPVGRLDLDSEGLLLLTTDGELTLRLTHPRYGHRKRYRVWCAEGRLDPEVARTLERGIDLADGPARAVAVRPLPGGCRIELVEGRNRQVRRMLEAVGYRVERLLRTDVAGLGLGDLAPGEWRRLDPPELARLGYTRAEPGGGDADRDGRSRTSSPAPPAGRPAAGEDRE